MNHQHFSLMDGSDVDSGRMPAEEGVGSECVEQKRREELESLLDGDKCVSCHASFDTRETVEQFPPRWFTGNKKLLYSLSCPLGSDSHAGTLHYSRWRELPLPSAYTLAIPEDGGTELEMREDVFTYETTQEVREDGRRIVSWHMNFAHSQLFVAYGGPLFAQDEACPHTITTGWTALLMIKT